MVGSMGRSDLKSPQQSTLYDLRAQAGAGTFSKAYQYAGLQTASALCLEQKGVLQHTII